MEHFSKSPTFTAFVNNLVERVGNSFVRAFNHHAPLTPARKLIESYNPVSVHMEIHEDEIVFRIKPSTVLDSVVFKAIHYAHMQNELSDRGA